MLRLVLSPAADTTKVLEENHQAISNRIFGETSNLVSAEDRMQLVKLLQPVIHFDSVAIVNGSGTEYLLLLDRESTYTCAVRDERARWSELIDEVVPARIDRLRRSHLALQQRGLGLAVRVTLKSPRGTAGSDASCIQPQFSETGTVFIRPVAITAYFNGSVSRDALARSASVLAGDTWIEARQPIGGP
ncbi:MAG: hypothetical protein V4558_08725 [Gemmatimonadota bacterium]